ncbi:hypothetical protein [Methylobrevis albus]|uniref:PspA/IM30 family protein n=1 Tax=Methylobrevis albus TaxID=2793297 RepID=A0A931MYQ5_9HYPH|nr:hypothetical protein [Methylobrevis albus]MBH0238687.1 hypothetical protein [Methylobrevis albus]
MFKTLSAWLGLFTARPAATDPAGDAATAAAHRAGQRRLEATADALGRARAALGIAMADDECLLRRLTRLEARAAELEAALATSPAGEAAVIAAEIGRIAAEREAAERARRTLGVDLRRLTAETRDAAAVHAAELRAEGARRRGEPPPRGGFGRVEMGRSFEATLADAEATLARLRARRTVHGA